MADQTEMNWYDPATANAEPSERSLNIDGSMHNGEGGYVAISIHVDSVEDLPSAVAMMQAAINAAPAGYTGGY